MNDVPMTNTPEVWPPDLLQVDVYYTDGLVTSRTMRLGADLSISAGPGHCINHVTITPASEKISGTAVGWHGKHDGQRV